MIDSFATQKTFAHLMHAMSRPGRTYRLDRGQALTGVLETLLDNEVTFSIAGFPGLEEEVRIATGSRPVPMEEADFFIVPSGDSHGDILRLKRGELKYPDSGATVIYSLESLAGGPLSIRLKGPGIESESRLSLSGWGPKEAFALREANAQYPLGVDCILVDREGLVACIPRSSTIEVA